MNIFYHRVEVCWVCICLNKEMTEKTSIEIIHNTDIYAQQYIWAAIYLRSEYKKWGQFYKADDLKTLHAPRCYIHNNYFLSIGQYLFLKKTCTLRLIYYRNIALHRIQYEN